MKANLNRPAPELETVGPRSETRSVSVPQPEWDFVGELAAARGSDKSKVVRWLIQKEMAAQSIHTA